MTEQQQTTPAYVADCWYIPETGRSVLSAREGKVYVYVGWVLLYDAETAQEVKRAPVSTTSPRALNGSILVDKDGKKQGIFSKSWALFYNPFFQPLAFLPIFLSLVLRLPLLVELGLLLIGIAGMLALYLPGFKKAKLFAAQAKRYASNTPVA